MNTPFDSQQGFQTMPYRNSLNPGPFMMARGGSVDDDYSAFDRFLHKYLPVITSVIGTMVGGPIGGMVGGGFGGAVSQRPNAKGEVNLGENILRGLGKGAITTGGMHLGSSMFGTPGGPGMGRMGGDGLLSKLFTKAPAVANLTQDKGQHALQQMIASRQGIPASQTSTGGMMGGLKELLGLQDAAPGTKGFYEPGGLFGGIASGPLDLALLATALAGKLGAKEIPSNEPLPPFMQQPQLQNKAPEKFVPFETPKRRVKRPPAGYRPGIDPEHQYFEAYAPGGYIEGGTGGQADKVNARVSDGEYVMDAESVAQLGDGNNKAGALKLDKLRRNLRKHKRSAPNTKIPPPAKEISAYMNQGRKRG